MSINVIISKAPEGPPLDIQVNALDSRSLKVTWKVCLTEIIIQITSHIATVFLLYE